MEFKIITLTSRSITVELKNETAYYSGSSFDVSLNDSVVKEGVATNILSCFELIPDTDYNLCLTDNRTGESSSITFKTKMESVRLNVRDFGAKGDGLHLDSIAIQAAILACPKEGTVFVPSGIYYCTPLFLKSYITIELEQGAVLKGHTSRDMYPIFPGCSRSTDETMDYYIGTWEGNPLDSYASLITGINVEHTAIIGEGIIDGNAQNSDWWVNPKVKRGAWRPRTVFLNGCSDVTLQGVTVMNSPAWTIHPFFSERLDFIDLKVENHKDSPNTDGLDPESCKDVRIIGVDFSVGDDCIAIKAGKLYMGKKHKEPAQNIVIRNCRMRHGHGAVVIGSEISGGAKNIEVNRCLFEKTDRGLRIKTRRGRGEDALVDDIKFSNIQMKEVLTPFVMNMFYFCDPDGKTEYVWSKDCLPVDEWTPKLGCFTFRDIECYDCEVSAAYFYGLPEQPIEKIAMQNISITFKDDALGGRPAMMSFADEVKKQGIYANYVQSLELHNVTITGYEGSRLTTEHITNLIED